MEAIKYPIEPFAGFLIEGERGLATSEADGLEADGSIAVEGAVPSKAMLRSNAIIPIKRPAQPSWLSTAFGS